MIIKGEEMIELSHVELEKQQLYITKLQRENRNVLM
jgi:hypothetical protein